MTKVSVATLRTKSKKELMDEVLKLKQELSSLRVAKATGNTPNKMTKIGDVRKDIARVLTVINQTRKELLRKSYAKKAWVPLDLRPKKTRAIRRRLTRHETNLQTRAQSIKARNNALRKYALKA